MTDLLVCGATGRLGAAIAARLATRGVAFRALVRPRTDATGLRELGAEVVTGDLMEPEGLSAAVAGTSTVVSAVTATARALDGDRTTTIDGVDRAGIAALVRAAETTGVERFVLVSMGLTPGMLRRAPLARAKLHAERVLRESRMRSVVVRPGPFQELWLSPATGIRPAQRLALIFGRGRAPASYVAVGDTAEACVRLALAGDPPAEVDAGGPEALTRHQVVDAFEQEMGVRFLRLQVPRPVLSAGSRVLQDRRPAVASMLGMSLTMDLEGVVVSPQPLRRLGIEPRATTAAVQEVVAAAAGTRPAP